jgi:uncharacterized membrane protein YdfJ with MMPL/SSD domain
LFILEFVLPIDDGRYLKSSSSRWVDKSDPVIHVDIACLEVAREKIGRLEVVNSTYLIRFVNMRTTAIVAKEYLRVLCIPAMVSDWLTYMTAVVLFR